MPFVVDMEAVINGVVLQIGDEHRNIDGSHPHSLPGRKALGLGCWLMIAGQVEELLALLDDVATRVVATLDQVGDWGLVGTQGGQHHSDIAADAVAVELLLDAGVGVLSEETGLHQPERDIVVVVDPLDGSTNAAQGIPWYAVSLCALDSAGPLASLVVDVPRGRRWTAGRGMGAYRDGEAIRPSFTSRLSDAVVGLSGLPSRHLGWRQYRALGAAALDLCLVADGTLDGYIDCSVDAHGPWDYLGAWLVCTEAGVTITDVAGRDLVVIDHSARRTPVAAATPELHAELVQARAGLP